MTFKAYYDDWISRRALDLAPRTVESYDRCMRFFLPLYDTEITELSTTQIIGVIRGVMDAGHERTAQMLVSLLRNMRLVTADDIRMPRHRPEDRKLLTPEQLHELRLALIGHPHELPLLLAMYAGLRRGEICALRYSDIRDGWIHVRRQIVKLDDGRTLETRPKSAAGNRDVPLPEQIKPLIWRSEGRITALTPSGLYQALQDILVGAGLPRVGLHALRHSFATAAIRGGADMRTLQLVLGHADYKTTASIYTHPDRDMLISCVAKAGQSML